MDAENKEPTTESVQEVKKDEKQEKDKKNKEKNKKKEKNGGRKRGRGCLANLFLFYFLLSLVAYTVMGVAIFYLNNEGENLKTEKQELKADLDQMQKRYQNLEEDYQEAIREEEINVSSARDVIGHLEEVFLVPEGQQPLVSTIEDLEELEESNEAFYKNAQKGDKLIVFDSIAVIFRAEEKKVINVTNLKLE